MCTSWTYSKLQMCLKTSPLNIKKRPPEVYRQNASNFYLEKHEWQASINISSGNFADNGLYTLLLYFYIQYPLII